MSPAKQSQRVTLKVEAVAQSPEAKLLNYVKQDPITPSREVALRALKAFYLPWALDGEVSEGEVVAIAQSAIEELQFRIFQIRQRYLNADSMGYQAVILSDRLNNPVSPTHGGANGGTQTYPPAPGIALESMREAINPNDLDDF